LAEKFFTCSKERPKPWYHVLVTDFIVFGPIFIGIPAAVINTVLRPPATVGLWLQHLAVALVFVIAGCMLRTVGISLGFHRGGTHPSYQASAMVKGTFYALGCMAGQGRMVNWLSDHWHHHIHSDEDEDLHSPRHGFWHAYVGWLRALLFNRFTYPQFANDRLIMIFSRSFFFWLGFGLALPALIGHFTGFGALRGFLYGGVLGILLCNNVTYWVNAGCHKYGKQNFNTGDDSTNFWLPGFWGKLLSYSLAVLSWGETNHNNHHAIAKSANHGMFKGELDLSAKLLNILEKCGLVWDVHWTTEEQARKRQADMLLSKEELKARTLAEHQAKQTTPQ
jgi:stearoyl-CoA desaturase (Delta-9 desaturase)